MNGAPLQHRPTAAPTPVETTGREDSPSGSRIVPPLMRDQEEGIAVAAKDESVQGTRIGATALSAMASKTGWASVGELEITRRISLVARLAR